MKLTPRQIEVLTEIFDGTEPNHREMTSAQRTGRVRVVDGMRGWNKSALIHAKTREITAYGLTALEPHYPGKAKIAAAIEARRAVEAEADAEKAREAQERADRHAAYTKRREAKLVEGYRRILAEHGFDHREASDSFVLSFGNAIAQCEMEVGNAL